MFEEYPKKVKLKDGQEIVIRPLEKKDKDRLLEFFRSLPLEDRLFLKDDVTDPKVIDSWVKNLDFDRVIPIVALKDNKIIGDATLHRSRFGWFQHVGEIRLVTHCDYRRKGLGLLLAREIFFLALKLKLQKVVAMMVEDQHAAIRVFSLLGFKKEALLEGHVIDHQGRKRNLIIMTQDVSILWQKIKDLIHDSFDDLSGIA